MQNTTPTAPKNPLIGTLEALQFENVSTGIVDKIYQLAEEVAQYEIDNKTVNAQNVGKVLQAKYMHKNKEFFIIVHFDESDDIIDIEEHCSGTIDGAAVYPRESVRSCLERNSVEVMLLHNHPSGLSTPSKADIAITQRLIKSLKTIDVTIKDHLILGVTIHSLKSSNPEIWEH